MMGTDLEVLRGKTLLDRDKISHPLAPMSTSEFVRSPKLQGKFGQLQWLLFSSVPRGSKLRTAARIDYS